MSSFLSARSSTKRGRKKREDAAKGPKKYRKQQDVGRRSPFFGRESAKFFGLF